MTSRDLTPVGQEFGKRTPVTAKEFIDGREVTEHANIPFYERRATRTTFLHLGYGEDSDEGRVGRHAIDLKLVDDSGATVDAQGTVRFAVYPDEEADEPKATGDEFTAGELRDQMQLNTRDRELFPVMKPGAQMDEVIVAEYEADPSETGYTFDASSSSAEFHITERSIDRS